MHPNFSPLSIWESREQRKRDDSWFEFGRVDDRLTSVHTTVKLVVLLSPLGSRLLMGNRRSVTDSDCPNGRVDIRSVIGMDVY